VTSGDGTDLTVEPRVVGSSRHFPGIRLMATGGVSLTLGPATGSETGPPLGGAGYWCPEACVATGVGASTRSWSIATNRASGSPRLISPTSATRRSR
jgi:hypothetical protein